MKYVIGCALVVVALFCTAATYLAVSFMVHNSKATAPHPLFANEWVGPNDWGGYAWYPMFPVHLDSGARMVYDERLNILMINRGSDSPLNNFPGENGIVRVNDGVARLPIWSDSAVLYDDEGLVDVVFLATEQAKDLFEAIQQDESLVDKLFDPSKRPIR